MIICKVAAVLKILLLCTSMYVCIDYVVLGPKYYLHAQHAVLYVLVLYSVPFINVYCKL